MKIMSKFLFLLLSIFMLTGCGAFFGEEEALGIVSIDPEEQSDGSIKLTIYYTDETSQEVIIPKGEDGLKGNGIKDIVPIAGDNETILKITYTDTSIPAVEIPVPHGAEIGEILVVDAQGNEIEDEENYDGKKYIKIVYTEPAKDEDGNVIPGEMKSTMFELPQGQAGNGIEEVIAGRLEADGSITPDKLNEDGSITIQFKYTQVEEPQTITIPANKGIANVEAIDTPTQYKIKITYTTKKEDGTPETGEYYWNKPVITQWLSGEIDPATYMGNIGDYYYNTREKSLWFKKALADDPNGFGYWDLIINFGVSETNCYITFNANGGLFNYGELKEPDSNPQVYTLKAGNYFYGSGLSFPTVYHPDGLQFLGWYTTETVTPTSTKFTDLTVINTNITLYAVWG